MKTYSDAAEYTEWLPLSMAKLGTSEGSNEDSRHFNKGSRKYYGIGFLLIIFSLYI